MFYYEEKEKKYYIWSDKSSWKYGPFEWVYVKNKEIWIVWKYINYGQYPWYKYSIWVWMDKIFLFSESGIEEIFEKNI